MMEDLIKDMIQRMCHTIETSVPTNGDFEPFREGFENPDISLVVNRFWLEVMQPPEGIKDRAWVRGLKFMADKVDSDAVAEILIEADTNDVLLQKLRDPEYPSKLLRLTTKLAYHLRDL